MLIFNLLLDGKSKKMNILTKAVLVIFLAIIYTSLHACGSGGQDEVMSWVDESIADILTQRPSGEALVAAKAVISGFESSSQQSLDGLNSEQDSLLKGVEPLVLKFANVFFKDVIYLKCESYGYNKYKCSHNVPAPNGGYAAMIFYVEYDEVGLDNTNGKMNVDIDFHGYQIKDDCRNWIDIEGFMYCSTEFQSNGTNYSFSGKCDTSNDEDDFINVWVGENKHLIGVSSDISFTESTSTADGIMSIDGVNYSFEDVKNVSLDACE